MHRPSSLPSIHSQTHNLVRTPSPTTTTSLKLYTVATDRYSVSLPTCRRVTSSPITPGVVYFFIFRFDE
ncbi:hypothetical protein VNO78_31134 [Psophocarpus tetragonolobus]|uniref:Uncharacterized protein n=1 Tax=Psophocarpus tetragonolobus TaxID=3891 RepID=A0AAN9RY49_PSOTE